MYQSFVCHWRERHSHPLVSVASGNISLLLSTAVVAGLVDILEINQCLACTGKLKSRIFYEEEVIMKHMMKARR